MLYNSILRCLTLIQEASEIWTSMDFSTLNNCSGSKEFRFQSVLCNVWNLDTLVWISDTLCVWKLKNARVWISDIWISDTSLFGMHTIIIGQKFRTYLNLNSDSAKALVLVFFKFFLKSVVDSNIFVKLNYVKNVTQN